MTIHLNANGSLTHNQKDEANRLNLNHMDYRLVVLSQVNDYYKTVPTPPLKVKASNPFIIIGYGPRWEKQAEKIRGTKIPIISTDICSKTLIEMGIIPDYIITLEEALKNVKVDLFPFDEIKKHKIKIIGSKITKKWLDDELDKIGVKMERYDFDIRYSSNVGLFASIIVKNLLKADKIILIGMNCWNDTVQIKDINWNYVNVIPPFLDWYTHWRRFFRESRGMIINCTEGGILYSDGVEKVDFNDLEIV